MNPDPVQRSQAEDLKQSIENAFGDLPYPGDENIVSVRDKYDEYDYTDNFFRGKHWLTLIKEKQRLPLGYGGLAFFTPQAWRFYLPAYLISAVEEIVDSKDKFDDPDIAFLTLFQLRPWRDLRLQNYFQERLSGMSSPQRQSILAWIEYVCPLLNKVYSEDCKSAYKVWHEAEYHE